MNDSATLVSACKCLVESRNLHWWHFVVQLQISKSLPSAKRAGGTGQHARCSCQPDVAVDHRRKCPCGAYTSTNLSNGTRLDAP